MVPGLVISFAQVVRMLLEDLPNCVGVESASGIDG